MQAAGRRCGVNYFAQGVSRLIARKIGVPGHHWRQILPARGGDAKGSGGDIISISRACPAIIDLEVEPNRSRFTHAQHEGGCRNGAGYFAQRHMGIRAQPFHYGIGLKFDLAMQASLASGRLRQYFRLCYGSQKGYPRKQVRQGIVCKARAEESVRAWKRSARCKKAKSAAMA